MRSSLPGRHRWTCGGAGLGLLVALLLSAMSPVAARGPREARATTPAVVEPDVEGLEPDPVPEATITFRPLSVVRKDEYTLGDVATVQAPDEAQRRRLESLVLGQSPGLGYRLTPHPRQIAASLERLGVTSAEASLSFPKQMAIEREVQEVNLVPFEGRIRDEVIAQLASQADPGRVIVERIQLPPSVTLVAGILSHRLDLRLPRRSVGSTSFVLELLVDGVSQKKFAGSLLVDREIDVLEATRAMKRGEVIRRGSLPVRKSARRLSQIRGAPLAEEDLSDMLRLSRDVGAGDALTWSCVKRQTLVKRGQPVRMVLQSAGGLYVATVGRARADGALGDTIEVENSSSGKRILAVVAGNQVVQVPF
ncbi:MAG TPA: flagellar basal body P-ring formation chaperone FlgA [Sumerlaeia bacterium]|nr:flagellar basal body P-ring formation chaperone FlgA [Sumerlaeia bacterium]